MSQVENTASAESVVRVMTWNVRGAARPNPSVLAGVVAAVDPDVLALQEVRPGQARRLAEALGGRELRWHAKHRPPFLPGLLGRRWTEGLAVITRGAVRGDAVTTVSTEAPFHSFRRRIAQDVVVDLGGRTLRVLNTHLASDDARSRGEQATRIVELLAGSAPGSVDVPAASTLVVGDLNTPDEQAVLGALAAFGLVETWPTVGQGDGWTNPAKAPVQRLDHVLAGAAFLPVAAKVIATPEVVRCSDHLPVVVDLRRADDD